MTHPALPRATLSRIFSRPEVWAFGFTNFMLWPLVAFTVQGMVGTGAVPVWLLGSVAGIVTLLQIRALVTQWPTVAGGAPSYITRLFPEHSSIGLYGAMAYLATWLSVIPISAVMVSDLIARQLDGLGFHVPALLIRVMFLLLLSLIAFGGGRALSTLHVMLLIPALAVFGAFVVSGLGAAPSAVAPGTIGGGGGPAAYAAALLVVMYVAYGMETSTPFIAETQMPQTVRRCLVAAAILMIPLLVGGSWVLLRQEAPLPRAPGLYDSLVASATGLWGPAAPGLVTLWLATVAVLVSATALAMGPRIIHQQAVDGLLGRWLGRVSPGSLLREPLIVCLVLTLPFLLVDPELLLTISLSGWAAAFAVLHFGLWRNRSRPYVRWPRLALGLGVLDVVALAAGGMVLGWLPMAIGLAVPATLMLLDRTLRHMPVPAAKEPPSDSALKAILRAAVPLEIGVVFTLVVGGVAVGWALGQHAARNSEPNPQLIILATLFAILVGVAWSSWTSARAMEALHGARRQMHAVLDSAMDPVITVDGTGRIQASNPAASQMFGLDRDDLKGKGLGELVEGLTGTADSWCEWAERRLRRPDGSVRFVAVISRPLGDSVYPRYAVTLNDLTERKQAEVDLALGEERLSLALSVAGQFVWDWNAQNDAFHVLMGGSTVLGYPPEEAAPVRGWWRALVHPDDQGMVEATFAAHLAGTTDMFEAEYRMRHKSGEYRWMLSRGRAVARDPDGRATRVTGTTMDQTARRTLEHQLVQAQKMEALGQLAGGVAHDFNNALQAILAAADLLSLKPTERIGDNAEELSQVRVAAERAAGLTRQLLTFSRQRPTRPESIELGTMVREVVRLIRRLIGPNIEIRTRIAPEALRVRADPALLEHAIINLAMNARDAMPQGGRLTLTTRLLDATGEWICLEIVDTGVGMDAELLERIFEPFFTTKPVGRGTGLGLPMVYGFVQQAGGRIEVDSEVGVGSTFRLVLKLDQFVEPATPESNAPIARGSEQVLLVEDEEGIRTLCASALEELGYAVLEVGSGEEAIERLEECGDRIAVVLTDVAMPGMGGLALGRWIKARFPNLPVGYLSGYLLGSQEDLARLDPTTLLTKPFRLEMLADLIRRLLDRVPASEKAGL